MPQLVDTMFEDRGWDAVGLAELAESAASAALRHLGLDPDRFEISLLGCSDSRIATLNADFRGKPTPTNVLSWPSEERGSDTPGAPPVLPRPAPGTTVELGDIAIALGTCRAEADVAGVPLQVHVSHLIVHGVLHLFGFDHIDDADATLMETTEVAILKDMGLSDPYQGAAAAMI